MCFDRRSSRTIQLDMDRIEKIHATIHLFKKIVKIGAVDTEIALLIVKKEEITEGKIYSTVDRFAERAKQARLVLGWVCIGMYGN